MKAVPVARTIQEITEDIRERALEQGSIATMMRTVFIACADEHSDLQKSAGELWEGLAAVARCTERETAAISAMVDEIHAQLRDGAQ